MKDHRIITYRRVSKALNKVFQGCTSATCPFREQGLGTANICDCKSTATGLKDQLNREMEKEGL